MTEKKIAIIRIKGDSGLKKPLRDTFKLLRLYKKNNCVVVSNTKVFAGMITKVKDSITWGEIDEPTFKILLEKRGKLPQNQKLTEQYLKDKVKISFDEFVKEFFASQKQLKDIPGLKLFFKLNPPRGGFERQGVKIAYSLGGALGYRKDKINDLIKRMA
ncbi:MAG: 50S ribosomal protein L30 [Candidatus Nanoarchaeia archaeon]|nr:50S ribosomal protein L30 [Candidatus Nanoarchaeia archaeon]